MNLRCHPVLVLLAASLLLSACSSTPIQTGDAEQRNRLYQAKAEQLSAQNNWQMEGRLAVSSDKDGGSGNFRWREGRDTSRMDFHGALGRGAWVMEADGSGAEISLADGTVHRAATVTELVWRVVGWKIPVENLAWWVRGLAAPGKVRERVIDGEGNISELQQNDWTIVYDRYREFEGVSLPVRLTARQGEWKVKLAIRDWSRGSAGAADG